MPDQLTLDIQYDNVQKQIEDLCKAGYHLEIVYEKSTPAMDEQWVLTVKRKSQTYVSSYQNFNFALRTLGALLK